MGSVSAIALPAGSKLKARPARATENNLRNVVEYFVTMLVIPLDWQADTPHADTAADMHLLCGNVPRGNLPTLRTIVESEEPAT
jgi:hypothetical protein